MYFLDVIKNKEELSNYQKEELADLAMNTFFAREMATKLRNARSRGRHGWWDEQLCTIEGLQMLLQKSVDDGDMVSVANYAGMIHARKVNV